MAVDYDPEYYARRAEEARALAAKALDPSVRAIHTEMASRYEELVLRAGPRLHPTGASPDPAIVALSSSALTAQRVVIPFAPPQPSARR